MDVSVPTVEEIPAEDMAAGKEAATDDKIVVNVEFKVKFTFSYPVPDKTTAILTTVSTILLGFDVHGVKVSPEAYAAIVASRIAVQNGLRISCVMPCPEPRRYCFMMELLPA